MANLTSLDTIPTLTALYKLKKLSPTTDTAKSATSSFNEQISLIRTDITALHVDAIVNAANNGLLGGGGVDGAIHKAAGPDLLKECRKLNGCETGEAKITNAYNLPCKKVIHTPGPIYSRSTHAEEETKLRNCYKNCLRLAKENGCKSIAFSCLSTGVYGYPSSAAAETAVQEVMKFLGENKGVMERVIFCTFLEKDEKAYKEWLPVYCPPAEGVDGGEDEGETELPELPSVPTEEPVQEGRREAKRVKVTHETEPERDVDQAKEK